MQELRAGASRRISGGMFCNLGPRPLLCCALELWHHWIPRQVHIQLLYVLVGSSVALNHNHFYANLFSSILIHPIFSVEIEIIPSRRWVMFKCFTTWKCCNFRFVKLDYIPVYSLEQMVETFEREVISHPPLYSSCWCVDLCSIIPRIITGNATGSIEWKLEYYWALENQNVTKFTPCDPIITICANLSSSLCLKWESAHIENGAFIVPTIYMCVLRAHIWCNSWPKD